MTALEKVELLRSGSSPRGLFDLIKPMHDLQSLRNEPRPLSTKARLTAVLDAYRAEGEAIAREWLRDWQLELEIQHGDGHGVVLMRKKDVSDSCADGLGDLEPKPAKAPDLATILVPELEDATRACIVKLPRP